ncbi:hypothetical protein AVEN_97006-1 [Araneus ventricosus]|uniref:Uncharacterized protein n=1 Tax=Araneus ventricosus TaxID=182803 RepID=A0A4Y2KC65_ARAVE|nr:hypothetical protein AVEN_97006-1 [Araneus ventricosus]
MDKAHVMSTSVTSFVDLCHTFIDLRRMSCRLDGQGTRYVDLRRTFSRLASHVLSTCVARFFDCTDTADVLSTCVPQESMTEISKKSPRRKKYPIVKLSCAQIRPANGKTPSLLATWLFTIGDICAQLTENRFALGDICAQLTKNRFVLGDLARVWFTIGDICVRLTENRFALGDMAVHNWRHLLPANGKSLRTWLGFDSQLATFAPG